MDDEFIGQRKEKEKVKKEGKKEELSHPDRGRRKKKEGWRKKRTEEWQRKEEEGGISFVVGGFSSLTVCTLCRPHLGRLFVERRKKRKGLHLWQVVLQEGLQAGHQHSERASLASSRRREVFLVLVLH